MIGFILYGILGLALAGAGISVVDKPWQFCVIMFIVVAIDLNSKYGP